MIRNSSSDRTEYDYTGFLRPGDWNPGCLNQAGSGTSARPAVLEFSHVIVIAPYQGFDRRVETSAKQAKNSADVEILYVLL